MAIYISDTFTDTNGTAIASHTPDVGGAWNTSGGITIQSNQLICGQFNSGHPYNSTTSMASADYEVLADVVWSVAADGNADMAGVIGRFNTAASDYYCAYYNTTGASWHLSKFISGGETSLGTSAMTYVQGQTHALTLRMQGSTITMLVDGTSLVSVTDATLTLKQNVGIYMEDVVSQAQRLDNYVVQDIVSGGGSSATMSSTFKNGKPSRPAPFKPMGDAFRPTKYGGWR